MESRCQECGMEAPGHTDWCPTVKSSVEGSRAISSPQPLRPKETRVSPPVDLSSRDPVEDPLAPAESEIQQIVQDWAGRIRDDRIHFAAQIPNALLEQAIKQLPAQARQEVVLALIDDSQGADGSRGLVLTEAGVHRYGYGDEALRPETSYGFGSLTDVHFRKGMRASIISINGYEFAAVKRAQKEAVDSFSRMLNAIMESLASGVGSSAITPWAWEELGEAKESLQHSRGFWKMLTKTFAFPAVALTFIALFVADMPGLGKLFMVALGWSLPLGCSFLGSWITKRKTEQWVERLRSDRDPAQRCNAAFTLVALEARDAIPLLKEVAANGSNHPMLRDYAQTALDRLGSGPTKDS